MLAVQLPRPSQGAALEVTPIPKYSSSFDWLVQQPIWKSNF